MKTFFVYTLLFSTLLLSCRKSKPADPDIPGQDQAASGNKEQITTLDQGKHCYQNITDQDIDRIKFVLNGKQISGSMRFDNFQKQSYIGAINGHIEGDVISVVYRFRVNGYNNYRNVYMKLDGEKLTFGIGKEEAKGDSAFIPDKSTIRYDGMMFVKVDCNK